MTFVSKPDAPREFLVRLVEDLVEFRDSLPDSHVQPRLLWGRQHVVAVFKALDPQQASTISLDQYHTGMKMLHLTGYNMQPPKTAEGLVAMDVFVDEAYRRLLNEFLAMIDCLPDEPCGCRNQVCPCTRPKMSVEGLLELHNGQGA